MGGSFARTYTGSFSRCIYSSWPLGEMMGDCHLEILRAFGFPFVSFQNSIFQHLF